MKTAEQIYTEYIGNGQIGVDFEKKHIIEAIKAYQAQFTSQLSRDELIEMMMSFFKHTKIPIIGNISKIAIGMFIDEYLSLNPTVQDSPIAMTEEGFNADLFAAYLTGQSDVRERALGGKGRSFASWYKDNDLASHLSSHVEPNEGMTEPQEWIEKHKHF